MSSHRLLRWAIAASVSTSLISAGPAASAVAAPRPTHLMVHVAPSTVLRGTLETFTGSVSPRVPGAQVLVQRLVGKSWLTVAHEKVSATGLLAFSIKAPHATGAWVLRVIRPASGGARAGASGTLHLRVVAKAFAVQAKGKPTTGQKLLVTGTVSLKATGSVWLQQLVGKTWHNLSSAKLAHSTFSVGATLAAGAHRLRVAKTFSATVAGGLSKSFLLTVPTNPAVTTVTLPSAQLRRAYTATLTATGGVAPYTWTASGLPTGLAVAADGVLSGTPTLVGTSAVTVSVSDAGGRTGTALFSTVVRVTAGSAWSWGTNDSGQLGNATLNSASSPTQVTGLTDATQIVGAGSGGGYALRADGTVAAWGVNTYGALGDGSGVNSTVPVTVSGLTGVIAVAPGLFLGAALKSDGTVWSWGYGGAGQLGNGTTANSPTPVQVPYLTGITAIASGGGATYALRSDGTVAAWGVGAAGALGNGTTTQSNTPVQVLGLTGVVAVAGGQESGYALKSDGTVWAWGWNAYGQLGDATTNNRSLPVQVFGMANVTHIESGYYAALALRSDGTVWDWGFNQYGALGNNSVINSSVPVAVSGLATVTAISGGGQSGYASKADGTEWAWGHNASGQLGNTTATDSSIPVEVSTLRGIFAIGGGNASSFAISLG